MPKTLFMLLLFLICAQAGMRASSRLKRRKEVLRAMLSDITRFDMRMEHSLEHIPSIIAHCKTAETEVFWDAFLLQLRMGANSVQEAWRKAMKEAREKDICFAALTEEDIAVFEEYARELGGSGFQVQQKNGIFLKKQLEAAHGEAAEQYGKKSRIYRSMGILGGLAIAILLW